VAGGSGTREAREARETRRKGGKEDKKRDVPRRRWRWWCWMR
jgi:hypothetical protein